MVNVTTVREIFIIINVKIFFKNSNLQPDNDQNVFEDCTQLILEFNNCQT